MKKIIFLCIYWTLAGNLAFSQNIDSVTLSKLKLNFVVPDMPAFKALGTEPSELLRPSTPQAFAVSISEFYQQGRLELPKEFSMEITPALLINSKRKIDSNFIRTYSTNKVWNSFRISLGTSSDSLLSPSGRSMALGLRLNVINKGDLATDQDYLSKVAWALGIFRVEARRELRKHINHLNKDTIKTNNIDTTKNPNWDLDFMDNKDKRDAFNQWLADDANEAQKRFAAKLDSLKQDYKKHNWNATKLDIAVALVTSSKDSLVKNIRYNKLSFWGTYALRTGESSQLLIGANVESYKNLRDTSDGSKNKMYANLAIPARFLIGTNRVKGFAEVQYKYSGKEISNHSLFNLGAEVNVYDGFWIHFYGGVDHNLNNGVGEFITNLDLKITLPEHFKFF